jgi:hypothetical protein
VITISGAYCIMFLVIIDTKLPNGKSDYKIEGYATRAGATFNWTLFDNSNRRKVVRRPSKVVMFNSDLVRPGSSNC